MKSYDLTGEAWRAYCIINGNDIVSRFLITRPAKLFWEPGHNFHRVQASGGEVYCVPAPGISPSGQMCILEWMPKDKEKPVQF